MSTLSCENCGAEFQPYRSWQRFCSPSCRDQHYSRYVRHSCADALRLLDSKVEDPEDPEVMGDDETKKSREV